MKLGRDPKSEAFQYTGTSGLPTFISPFEGLDEGHGFREEGGVHKGGGLFSPPPLGRLQYCRPLINALPCLNKGYLRDPKVGGSPTPRNPQTRSVRKP